MPDPGIVAAVAVTSKRAIALDADERTTAGIALPRGCGVLGPPTTDDEEESTDARARA